ncbi:MAG: hypothetical protein RIR70_877 [Pseudomonadota bacterium]|jgi:lipoprotein NlpD
MRGRIRHCARHAAPLVAALFAACGTPVPAPVIDRNTPGSAIKSAAPARTAPAAAPTAAPAGFHVVKKGETLASIALEYGQDYKELVAWNNLDNPNMIRVGQQLRVASSEGAVVVKPIAMNAPQEVRPAESPAAVSANTDVMKREPLGGKVAYSEAAWAAVNKGNDKVISPARVEAKAEVKAEPKAEAKPEQKEVVGADAVDWVWPAGGKVVTAFAEGSSKGIGIAGKLGDAVIAASAGKVLYAGEDLRGYGKLVVLKHNANFLSVYAHNNQILVREGQMVAKGEKIAELGKSDSDQPKLHFEIRRQGKPVDPVKLLPTR